MSEFLEILAEEHQVLSGAAVNQALNRCSARKQAQADKLHTAQQARAALLAELGFAHTPQDLRPVAQRYPDLHTLIEGLVALVKTARERNQENGVLIESWQNRHQAALLKLQSLINARDNRLYDASGRTKTTPGVRFASAG